MWRASSAPSTGVSPADLHREEGVPGATLRRRSGLPRLLRGTRDDDVLDRPAAIDHHDLAGQPARALHLRQPQRLSLQTLYTCFFRTDQMNPSYQKCMIDTTDTNASAQRVSGSTISAHTP